MPCQQLVRHLPAVWVLLGLLRYVLPATGVTDQIPTSMRYTRVLARVCCLHTVPCLLPLLTVHVSAALPLLQVCCVGGWDPGLWSWGRGGVQRGDGCYPRGARGSPTACSRDHTPPHATRSHASGSCRALFSSRAHPCQQQLQGDHDNGDRQLQPQLHPRIPAEPQPLGAPRLTYPWGPGLQHLPRWVHQKGPAHFMYLIGLHLLPPFPVWLAMVRQHTPLHVHTMSDGVSGLVLVAGGAACTAAMEKTCLYSQPATTTAATQKARLACGATLWRKGWKSLQASSHVASCVVRLPGRC
jgi:hypothetical protein